MAVVIHEFEVEAQGTNQPASTAMPSEAGTAPQPGVPELERLVRCYQDRYERVRAH